MSTTWLPVISPSSENRYGALWNSGAVHSRTPPGSMRYSGARAVTASSVPGSPATMTLGRPVEPPEVGAFHADGAGTDGGGVAGPVGWYPSGSTVVPGGATPGSVPGARPATTGGRTTSSTAVSSPAASRCDTGCGTAPSFHAASVSA